MFGDIWSFLQQAGPVVLIILGVVIFIFAGIAKWLVRLMGAGIVIYGLLVLLGYL